MKIEVITGRELSRAEQANWSRLQQADARLENPYFSAQFTRAVAAVRDDLFVGVLGEGEQTVGYFPFQRDAGTRHGTPAGGRLSDYHGLIAAEDLSDALTAEELIERCGLVSWKFNHLLAAQTLFQTHHARLSRSPALDLSHGFDVYAETQRRNGSQVIKKIESCRRKLERERSALRFVAHTTDAGVLRWLLAGKSAQLSATGKEDIFAWGWTRALIELIHATQEDDFAGALSALYAGERLVAAHMGMRSRRVLHYWFPYYDREFAPYSPGLILLLEMARAASAAGIGLIDLGRGEDPYKLRLMNTATLIAEGAVSLSRPSHTPARGERGLTVRVTR